MALTDTENIELLELLEAEEVHKRYNLREYIFPEEGKLSAKNYPKHMGFFAAGKDYMIRLFAAGNRCGKSYSACYELSCHLTGTYPHFWEGLVINEPDTYWCGSYTYEKVRDGLQMALLGTYSDVGTGLVPKERIKYAKPKHGVAGNYEYVEVWFGPDLEQAKQNNKYSIVYFKTYDAGIEGWAAAAVKGVILDECPKLDVYLEAKQRTITKKGFVMVTFTPDKGMNDTTLAFWPDGDYTPGAKTDNKHVTFCSVYDAPHLDEDMIKKMQEDMPEYLQQAKLYGIPYLGQGGVFPVDRGQIIIEPFDIPNNWPRCFGMDTGWVATAALFGAQDPNTGVVYLYAEYKEGQMPPPVHAEAIKRIRDSKGKFEEMVGCVDCHSQSKNTRGEQDFQLYSELGLSLFPSDGSAGSVEPRILKTYDMFATGRLKVFSTLRKTISEYGIFRRGDDGKPIKGNTITNGMHLMDCLLYLICHALDYAQPIPDLDDLWEHHSLMINNRSPVTGY